MSTRRDLPDDVMAQILLHLPVISLLRFKTVCKCWRALIENTAFVAQHIQTHNNDSDNGNLIIKNPSDYCSKDMFFLLFGDEFEACTKLELPPHPYFEDDCWETYLELVASCNGIVCIHHRKTGEVALWNPATKQFRALPDPCPHIGPDNRRNFVYLGFGFDAQTNDYKVVRIVFTSLKDKQVEVYILSTDSWRIINVVLPVDNIAYHPKALYRNGIYVWAGRKFREDDSEGLVVFCDSILTFDFSDEAMGIMDFPDVGKSRYLTIIGEFIGCISRTGYGEDDYHHFEIWVLKEYGDKDSWTKVYTIGPISALAYPHGFSKNGQFLVFTIMAQPLIICNPVTQEMKNVQVRTHWYFEFAVYKESLVSIKA